jgi:predicted dehydrogenase
MSFRLRVAVVGCGYWGGNYVRIFNDMPEVDMVAVCDEQPANLAKIGKRFPDIELLTSLDDVLNRSDINAVVVATNASTHYAITKPCIEAGKHILLEKPMTTLVDDAEELIYLAQVHNVTLMVGHIYLYNPGIRKVKSCIEEDSSGQLYYLYTRRTNLGPIRHDVNALWDLAPHDVSIMNYLLSGTPEWVSAVGHKALKNQNEDVGFIVLGYPNDVIGHIHVSWADANKVREIAVVGSERRIVFNDLNPLEPVRIYEKGVVASEPFGYGEHQFSIRNGDILSPSINIAEPLKEQCYHFLECVTEGKQPLTNGENGLEVVQVMQAVSQSIESRGMPVPIQNTSVSSLRN